MAFNLGDVLKNVSSLDTGLDERESLEYIDIGLIDADVKNFYRVGEIEDLAAKIELVGLQQPLRVRTSEADAGRVVLISGHRRLAALKLLASEGKAAFRRAPCIRERAGDSAAMKELKLIFGNSGTRVRSAPEIAQEAARTEELLYTLKNEGVEFPGRMRDLVAQACKISASKLARLKAIDKKLTEPRLRAAYERGEIGETVAYALTQKDDAARAEIEEAFDGRYGLLTEETVLNWEKIQARKAEWEARRQRLNRPSAAPQKSQIEAQRSGPDWESTTDGMDALSPQGGSEGYGAREDDGPPRSPAPTEGDGDGEVYPRAATENAVRALVGARPNLFEIALFGCGMKDGIAALKDEFKHSGGGYRGFWFSANSKGIEIRADYHKKYVFLRWSELWEQLALIALKEAAERRKR